MPCPDPFDLELVYPLDAFVQRLDAILLAQGLPLPSWSTLDPWTIHAYFPPEIRAYGYRLATVRVEPDWQLLRIMNDDLGEELDWDVVCRSRADALALLLGAADLQPLYLTHAEESPDGRLRLFVGDAVAAEIERLPFGAAPPGLVRRVASAIKAASIDNRRGAMAALGRIAGLEALAQEAWNPETTRRDLMALSPHALAVLLRRFVRGVLGRDVPLHVAQEMTARLFHADSWNHFVAFYKEGLCVHSPAVLYHEGGLTAYRSLPEAIAAFSLLARQRPDLTVGCKWKTHPSTAFELTLAEPYDPFGPRHAKTASCGYGLKHTHGAVSGDYLVAARSILAAGDGPSAALAAYFGVDEGIERQWAHSCGRCFPDGVQTQRIGRWLFALTFEDGRPYGIEIREVRSDGVVSTERRYLLVYKAGVHYRNGEITMLYDTDAEQLRDVWTRGQVEAFQTFSGLHVG